MAIDLPNKSDLDALADLLTEKLIGRIRNLDPRAVVLAGDDDRLLTTEEAAAFCSCCAKSLYNNDIPQVRLPSGGVRYRLGTLRGFSRSREKSGGRP